MIRQLIFVATAVAAAAQPPGPSMTVPALGYVFDDNAKAIRLISGVPGAASLDATVSTDTSLDSAFVHSRARIAIANSKDGGLLLVQWSAAPRVVALTSSLGRVNQVAFSMAGDRVAITDGVAVETWSGLGVDPVREAAFHPNGGVAALAMNQDGVVAAATGKGSILQLGDETRVIANGGDWTDLIFLPNGKDLLATDATARSLVLIQNALANASPSILLTLDQELGALAVASDGTRAVLAGGSAVNVVNLADGSSQSISCNCRAQRFDRLEGNLVFHVADSRTGSELVVDADAAAPRVMPLLPLNGGSAQ